MIILPEKKIVLLLNPRTGSGSLKRAVLKRYPDAMMLYRHMEADGVPFGYEAWTKIGVVREPVERLWSLYKFIDQQHNPIYPEWEWAIRESVQRPFEDWLLHNEVVFHNAHPVGMSEKFFPEFSTLHTFPENRKSQWWTLRPDLGTQIYQFEHLRFLEERLDIELPRANATTPDPAPELSPKARDYVENVFKWDIQVTNAKTDLVPFELLPVKMQDAA